MRKNMSTDSEDVINKIIQEADKLYEFIIKYSKSMGIPKDYGTGEKLTMIEAHLLTYINEHPGITPKDLANLWNRTKGAM